MSQFAPSSQRIDLGFVTFAAEGWVPARRGTLSRGWQGRACTVEAAPGGYRAAVDGREVGTFPDREEAVRALYAAVVPARPAVARG